MLKANWSRFFSLLAIVFIGICFVTGVGGITPKVTKTVNQYYHEVNVADVIIKSSASTGLTENQISRAKSLADQSQTLMTFDQKVENGSGEEDDQYVRYYFYDYQEDSQINQLQLLEGDWPTSEDQCLVERASDKMDELSLGDKVTYQYTTLVDGLPVSASQEYTISGICQNPLYYYKDGDYYIDQEKGIDEKIYLDVITYIHTTDYLVTDMYLSFENTQDMDYFSSKYQSQSKKNINQCKLTVGIENTTYLSLRENKSYESLRSISEKINLIAIVFPIFFILVVALVVLSTISRLINEERSKIGCYKSLGYSTTRIMMKYFIFALSATLIGVALGLVLGGLFIPQVVYPAFETILYLPPMAHTYNFLTGGICSAIMLASVFFITLYVGVKTIHEKPANLFQRKSPKPGRKILLERIPFIWKRIRFSLKSTFRNMFRYLGRFFMIVVSVGGATAITTAGFGLYDISDTTIISNGIEVNIESTLQLISWIIILFSLGLCALVIYNLTTMNISEREREIATLKVLGYVNGEVNFYIIREIVLTSLIGVIIGIPLGTLFLWGLFTLLDFGSLHDVNWYSYLFAGVLVFIFIIIINLLLTPRIKKVNMNDSLKSLE